MSSVTTRGLQDEALHAATLTWIHNVLQPFDIPPDDHDFMTAVLLSQHVALSDLQALVSSSFDDDGGLHEKRPNVPDQDALSLTWAAPGQLASQLQSQELWRTTDSLIALAQINQTQPWLKTQTTPSLSPWQETDRLIARAKELQGHAEILQPPAATPDLPIKPEIASTKKRKRKQAPGVASHFFGDECSAITTKRQRQPGPLVSKDAVSSSPKQLYVDVSQYPKSKEEQPVEIAEHSQGGQEVTCAEPLKEEPPKVEPSKRNLGDRVLRGRRKSSHYFTPPPSSTKSPSKRPPAGTISCMPFPPLDAPSFGLIQSKVAHEPFWLLVVVTFLIKTKGRTAAPVFWAVKERFPTPDALADPDNAIELLDMIRHLGLAQHRLGILQKYGRLWRDSPPAAGKVYRVRNYDRRDLPTHQDASDDKVQDRAGNDGMLTPKKDEPATDAEAWEIGHMTAGKYALDSWRIFCRDVLLGRAEGWNGEGARPEFQPEWCRVRPADKELRAYLRWMWMREGFEWDPVTGERTALRPEMMKAVNERRVEWDDAGSLRIVEEPRLQEDINPS